MKIGIVYPVVNQFELAIKAMESIKTQYDWQPFIIPQWEDLRPLSAAWNMGLIQAINRGFDYILVSNDDVLYSPWMIDNLIETFEDSSDSVVMVTACNDQGQCPDPNMIKSYSAIENPTRAEHPDFSCWMVRKNFLDLVGPLDYNIYPAFYEDNEMHIRINVLGYKAITTTAAPYYHYGSRTQATGSVVSGDAFNANGQYVREKWGTVDAAALNYRFPFNDPNNDPREVKPEWRKS